MGTYDINLALHIFTDSAAQSVEILTNILFLLFRADRRHLLDNKMPLQEYFDIFNSWMKSSIAASWLSLAQGQEMRETTDSYKIAD